MVTLHTLGRELEVDGVHPRMGRCVVDSGASSILVGLEFAAMLLKCRKERLIPGDTFTTAGGQKEKAVGRTMDQLKFTVARGTGGATSITAPVIVVNTNLFDSLLGMDFLGPLFAYFDPLTEDFCYQVDCKSIVKMPRIIGKIPGSCHTTSPREHRHNYMAGIIESADDLHESVLDDEEETAARLAEDALVGKQEVSITLPQLLSMCPLLQPFRPLILTSINLV